MNSIVPGTVNVFKKTNNDLTPLYAAAQRGCLDVIEFLVTAGAKWDEPNLQLITPFHAAVERGELEVCKYLLSLDPPADPFKTNSTDMSVMHTAAKFGRVKLLKFLLELGLDVNATDMYGSTPLDCARSFGKTEAAEYLSSLGAEAGNDWLRDPKSRARSMLAKYRMVGAGDGGGRVSKIDGDIDGTIKEGELFGVDNQDVDSYEKARENEQDEIYDD